MSDSRSQQEPSMEEILASIRRIISEDADGPKSAAPVASAHVADPLGDDDVLDLTDRFDEEAPAPSRGASAVNLFDDDFAQPPARPSFSEEMDDDLGLMSGNSVSATANAFAALDEHEEPEPPPPPPRAAAPSNLGAGITVEQLVREALRPLLKDWLDHHLPPIVETIVRSEVERSRRR